MRFLKKPESVLIDILDYLKQVKATPEEKIYLTRHPGHILREDKELMHYDCYQGCNPDSGNLIT